MSDSPRRDERTPGAAGHPEPGSGHDDAKTETVEAGPDTPLVDGVPGAFGPNVRGESPVDDLLTNKTSDVG